MHCQAELPRTATYFDTRTEVPTTPQGREPAARRSCCAVAPSFLPVEAQLRPRAGVSWLQGPCVGRALGAMATWAALTCSHWRWPALNGYSLGAPARPTVLKRRDDAAAQLC